MIMGATQLAKRFIARDGTLVWVRLLRRKDAPLLVNLFEHMGSESRYRRFHQPADDVPLAQVWEEAVKIATAVPDEQLGLIAFVDLPGEEEVVAGVARIVWLNETMAEIAMSVRDDMQGQGIGGRLLTMILELAQIVGVETVIGTVQNENGPIWHLFSQLPFPITRTIEGTESEIGIDLMGIKEGVETAV
ncbi:MAG: GNAT family N-acetyltransferase [Chloroflexi bacterium]|nr:GNAT family N-acetyltransferase [Chloroflexota bacterium]